MELLSYVNLTADDSQKLEKPLSLFTIIPIETTIENKAIELRKNYHLKLPDAIICATALSLDCFLVSTDQKLENVEELNLLAFKI